MANELTGDYDVVTAFSLGAVNRLLAAMHRGKRLPHAMSLSVDISILDGIVVGAEERSGLATSDPGRVKQAARAGVTGALSAELIRTVDPVVNPPAKSTAAAIGIGLHTVHVGVAQLQLGPPIMKIAPNRTDRAEIHTPARIHYRADDQTKPLPPFMRGDLVTSFGVKQVASPTGPNIVVDVTGSSGSVHFDPVFASETLDADEQKFIDRAFTQSLKRSFHPSSSPLPSGLRQMHFKAFPAEDAVAVMMTVTSDTQPSPNSVPAVVLGRRDQFTLAVNGSTITRPFADAVNGAVNHRPPTVDTKVVIDYLFGTYTFHIFTTVRVGRARVQLLDTGAPNGTILLTVPVSVRFGWKDKPFFVRDPVNFRFTISQAFTLTLNGRQVGLQPLGDLDVDISDSVPDKEADSAREQARTLFDQTWESQQAAIQTQVNKALGADGLQSFLTAMMNPKPSQSPPPGAPVPEHIQPQLTYTRFEIRPAGIILHGTLAVPPWPDAHVEYDKDVWAPAATPEYRALNSWIPGGTIEEFQWTFPQQQVVKDRDRFTTVNAPALSTLFSRICLGYTGSRITAEGRVFFETVNAPSLCKWTGGPIVGWDHGFVLEADRPHVTVHQPGRSPDQPLEVLGHISPWAPDGTRAGTANLVVHFPDDRSVKEYDLFPRALAQSGRTDTVAALLCVPTPEQLARVRAAEGMLYADDAAGWEKLLGVRERPATVVLDPNGKEIWRRHGDITSEQLAQALRKHLAPGGRLFPQSIETPFRAGSPSPNFVFDSPDAAADKLTLRSLKGRPAALVFLRESSAPSLQTLQNLRKAAATQLEESGSAIVVIVDGEHREFVRKLAANCIEGHVVIMADPDRRIAKAYGVSLWPTVVFLDSSGLVQDVRVGLVSAQELAPAAASQPVEADEPEKEY